LLDLSPLS